MMNPFLKYSLFALPLMLSACAGDIRETLGLGKNAPDEFVVVSRPPLSVPPDFQLRPPVAADQSSTVPYGISPEAEAQKTLLGTVKPQATATPLRQPAVDTAVIPVEVTNTPTGATASFLKKAGAAQAEPDIRQQLGADAKAPAAEASEARSLYEQVTGKDKTNAVVDPKKESKRLLENKQAGKAATEGETPTLPASSPSVLDRIF